MIFWIVYYKPFAKPLNQKKALICEFLVLIPTLVATTYAFMDYYGIDEPEFRYNIGWAFPVCAYSVIVVTISIFLYELVHKIKQWI